MISLGVAELVAFIRRSSCAASSAAKPGSPPTAPNCCRLFDWSFGPQIQIYYLFAAWTLIAMIPMYALTRTPLGRIVQRGARQSRASRSSSVMIRTVIRYIAVLLRRLLRRHRRRAVGDQFRDRQLGLSRRRAIRHRAVRGLYRRRRPVHRARSSARSSSPSLSLGLERPHLGAGSSISALIFIAVIMFAPGGIAGLLDEAPPGAARRHAGDPCSGPIWWRLPPTVAMLAGLVLAHRDRGASHRSNAADDPDIHAFGFGCSMRQAR